MATDTKTYLKPSKVMMLTESELRKSVGLDVVSLATIEQAFADLANGHVTIPPPMAIEFPTSDGEIHIKSAYLHGKDAFAIKIASGFYRNTERGQPTASGMMVLVSSETGFLEAIFLDNGYLTQLRTALAGAIAAKYFARKKLGTVGIIGAGTQGRYQLRAVQLVRQFNKGVIFDRVPSLATEYANEMSSELGLTVTPAESVSEVVHESDLVVTSTPSRRPFLMLEHIHPGIHITAMGADGPGKQELDPQILGHADRLGCDSKQQCFRLGELQHGLKHGTITEQSTIVELGEVITGQKPGRQHEDEVTVCDLTGVGVQDTAIALFAYNLARQAALGTLFAP
jgi:ornithine cyclodeaminase